MTTHIRLHYAPDNASLCIRLALEACGMEYETALVDRRARAQESPAYRALNPAGLIPVLETPDGPVFETAAILLWLAEQPSGNGLMPQAGAADRGAALSWLIYMANTLHPRLRMLFYPEKYATGDAIAPMTAATRDGVRQSLDLIERMASDAPPWLTPGAPSAHICYLCPMLRWIALYPAGTTGWFELRSWPALFEIAKVTEMTDWAIAASKPEGLGSFAFSDPSAPNPPEGSAT